MTPQLYSPALHAAPYPTGEDLMDRALQPYRVWVPEKTIAVLGYSQEPERELVQSEVEKAEIPVYQRRGGGGAVLLSAGCTCLALRMKRNKAAAIADYFASANGFIQTTLQEEMGIETVPAGISDLAVGDRKISGSSLYLPREYALYLGSVLVSAPLSDMDRYLAFPSREPEYRRQRSHGDFLRNISEMPGLNSVTPETLKRLIEKRLSPEKNRLELDFPGNPL